MANNDSENVLKQARQFQADGQAAQAIAAYLAADKIWPEGTDLRERADLWLQLGTLYQGQQDYGRAQTAFDTAATLAGQAADTSKQIEALYNQGLSFQDDVATGNKLPQAISSYEAALALATQTEDTASIGVLCLSLGWAYSWQERPAEAIEYFLAAASTTVLDEADFETAFTSLSTLGILLSNANRPREAIPFYQKALALAEKVVDQVAVANTLGNLGLAYEKSGQLDEAIKSYQANYDMLYAVGDVNYKTIGNILKQLKSRRK